MKFTDKVVGTVNIPVNVTENDVEGIIVGSFEGGSNYWMGLDNSGSEWALKPKGVPSSTWATHLLLTGETVHLFEINEGDFEGGEPSEIFNLTLEKLLNGISLNSAQRPNHSDIESMDASDYDCVVQYALFGQVTYG